MIKKIKRKFILLSMLPLLLMMFCLVVGINAVNYAVFIRDADSVTEAVISQDKMLDLPSLPGFHGDNKPPQDIEHQSMHDARYFKVVLDKNNEVKYLSATETADISESEALEYATDVLDGEEVGFADTYRYRVESIGRDKIIVFLDCSNMIDSIKDFALSSAFVSIIAYLAVLLIIILLADRIIKPFKENYEKQKQFITDAGHEIKTPLTIINANLDLCEMEHGANEYTCEIRAQVENMRELTGSLVFLAKMEEESAVPMIDLPLSDIVEETVSSFSAPSQLSGKTVSTNIVPMISVKGDDRSIRALLSILIDNAIKYSPKDSDIYVSLSKHGKSALLSVKNKSVNEIKSEEINKIFERFWRPDSSRNSERGGHGIGLSVARAVAEKHGGKITAQAERDELTITVTFPS